MINIEARDHSPTSDSSHGYHFPPKHCISTRPGRTTEREKDSGYCRNLRLLTPSAANYALGSFRTLSVYPTTVLSESNEPINDASERLPVSIHDHIFSNWGQFSFPNFPSPIFVFFEVFSHWHYLRLLVHHGSATRY